MIGSLRPSPACAAGILRDVFGQLPVAFGFRLWNGEEVRWGAGEPACTAVITTPETFVRLMRDPTPYNFAVAYVEGAIDIEGDLFVAMEVANVVEEVRLSPMQKARLLLKLWRGRA
jgi:hypothetical protein